MKRRDGTAIEDSRDFVEVLVSREYESPLKDVFASTILGGTEFIKKIQEKNLVSVRNNRNVPALTELSVGKTITEIRAAADARFGKGT